MKYPILNPPESEADFVDILERLGSFAQVQGRPPSQHAKELAESKLGKYLSRLRTNYKAAIHGMAEKSRRTAYEALLTKYPILEPPDSDADFADKLERIGAFVRLTGRSPNKRAKEPVEKSLGSDRGHSAPVLVTALL
jgi:hypothetical protein